MLCILISTKENMKKLCFVLMLYFIESACGEQWTYDDESLWEGVCTTGREQSPINIISKESVKDFDCDVIKSPLRFQGYDKVSLSGHNNGHTLEWKVAPGSSVTLSGGPLADEYTFVQFHLHWISEHAIDGDKFPMELHLVHVKSSPLPLGAMSHPEGYAVIGIPVQIKENLQGDPFQDLMRDIPLILNSTQILPSRDINVKSLFSSEPQSYYTYRGSLTTPKCSESVIWIVNDQPTFISGEKYKIITKTKIGSTTNFRELQPLNYRLVYKTVNSCAAIQPSLMAIISSLFYCATNAIGQIFNRGFSYFFNSRHRYLTKVNSP